LLHHDHPTVLDHAEYKQEKHWSDDSEFDGSSALSVSSASPADLLHWQIICQ
jgi:hypothetical protein